MTLVSEGRLAEAEAAYRAILAIRERVLGLEHFQTLNTRDDLAEVLAAEAETEQRAVLCVKERSMDAPFPHGKPGPAS